MPRADNRRAARSIRGCRAECRRATTIVSAPAREVRRRDRARRDRAPDRLAVGPGARSNAERVRPARAGADLPERASTGSVGASRPMAMTSSRRGLTTRPTTPRRSFEECVRRDRGCGRPARLFVRPVSDSRPSATARAGSSGVDGSLWKASDPSVSRREVGERPTGVDTHPQLARSAQAARARVRGPGRRSRRPGKAARRSEAPGRARSPRLADRARRGPFSDRLRREVELDPQLRQLVSRARGRVDQVADHPLPRTSGPGPSSSPLKLPCRSPIRRPSIRRPRASRPPSAVHSRACGRTARLPALRTGAGRFAKNSASRSLNSWRSSTWIAPRRRRDQESYRECLQLSDHRSLQRSSNGPRCKMSPARYRSSTRTVLGPLSDSYYRRRSGKGR